MLKRSLKEEMDGLIEFIRSKVLNRQLDHYDVCHLTAAHFELYNEDDLMPTWLSRIIEGEISDAKNGETNN